MKVSTFCELCQCFRTPKELLLTERQFSTEVVKPVEIASDNNIRMLEQLNRTFELLQNEKLAITEMPGLLDDLKIAVSKAIFTLISFQVVVTEKQEGK